MEYTIKELISSLKTDLIETENSLASLEKMVEETKVRVSSTKDTIFVLEGKF